MTLERYSQVRQLFIELCDRPPSMQQKLVDILAADDPVLKAEVLELLRMDGRPSPGFMATMRRWSREARRKTIAHLKNERRFRAHSIPSHN